ncbi:uncharacterized protein METZ01_LOCUS501735 [marine metagenome]|uniref:Uncharacterized protein n=1 Tax=marine metagenome TaxID=408172 RepID=A0A383DWL2_9ZZZZ
MVHEQLEAQLENMLFTDENQSQ